MNKRKNREKAETMRRSKKTKGKKYSSKVINGNVVMTERIYKSGFLCIILILADEETKWINKR